MVLVAYPFVKPQFFDNNGIVCAANTQLFVYLAGTSTKTTTWADALSVGANPNPIRLDASGRANIFLAPGSYKFVLAPFLDSDPPVSPIWTVDNVVSYAPFTATGLQVFTSPGATTWDKPAGGANLVYVSIIGGGAGGGSGRRGAAGSIRGGGGGGGSSAYTNITIPGSIVGASETVTVGAAGVGAAGIAVNDTDGALGGAGTQSSFGTWGIASGFTSGGGGGTAAAGGAGGSAGNAGQLPGVAGGAGSNGTAAAVNGVLGPYILPGGGGGGGGINAANASTNGAFGGTGSFAAGSWAGGAGGIVGASNAVAGSDVTASLANGGGGGGGGAATDHLNGANGGKYGAGGGGGGGSLNPTTSGAGGNGGQGIVIVLTI